jgi:hypothetical protein
VKPLPAVLKSLINASTDVDPNYEESFYESGQIITDEDRQVLANEVTTLFVTQISKCADHSCNLV